MSEFTEGPWTIETPCGFPYSGLYVVPVVRKDFPFYIAQVRQLREREESEANAELIAFAPTLKQQRDDLLEAAKWINDIISTACDGGDAWCAVRDRPGASEWAKNLEAAIANCE